MKKNWMRFLTAIACCGLITSAAATSVSADLTEEQLAIAEEYIAADDRVGLYDYLLNDVYAGPHFGYLDFWTHGYTGEYILPGTYPYADEYYQLVLDWFVYCNAEPGPPLAAPIYYGDVNQDSKVSLMDVLTAHKICARKIQVSNYTQAQCADCDGNQRIDTSDVTLILQYIVRKISDFPVNEW